MKDIFFSYKSEDRERVRPIHDALVAEGFDVFWDQKVPAGQDWDRFIRGHLTESKCALVFWSRESIGSDNIRHEAAVAKDQGKLIAVLLEPLAAEQFPMGLYTLQAVNLCNWKGDIDDAEWKKLRREVEDKLTPLWMRQRTAELEAELEAQRGRLAAVDSRDKVLRAQIAREARVQEELKQQLDKAAEEESSLKALAEDLKQQRDRAVEEVSSLKMAAEGSKQQRDKAAEEVSSLKSAAEELKQQRDKAVEEVSALKGAVEQLGRRCSEVESQAVELSQRLTESEVQRLTSAQQSETATRRAAEAETELQDIRRKMDALLAQQTKVGIVQQAFQDVGEQVPQGQRALEHAGEKNLKVEQVTERAGKKNWQTIPLAILYAVGLVFILHAFSGGGAAYLVIGTLALVAGVVVDVVRRRKARREAGASREERQSGNTSIESSVENLSSTAASTEKHEPSLR